MADVANNILRSDRIGTRKTIKHELARFDRELTEESGSSVGIAPAEPRGLPSTYRTNHESSIVETDQLRIAGPT
jgi:hypothetical protein